MTHGAGGNCEARLLVAVAEAFCDTGFLVLRINLPFRQERSFGPPSPGGAARDREGLKRAVELLKKELMKKESVKQNLSERVFLGGHSYGGRQSTMLAAENAGLVEGLLLFSYPLHPPRKPQQLRTAHFPQLKTPSLFVHGSRDPFGLLEELKSALDHLAYKKRGHNFGPLCNSGEYLRDLISAKAPSSDVSPAVMLKLSLRTCISPEKISSVSQGNCEIAISHRNQVACMAGDEESDAFTLRKSLPGQRAVDMPPGTSKSRPPVPAQCLWGP
jgi:uncharacterized protein